MKRDNYMRKWISIFLAIVMCMGIAVPVMATENSVDAETGLPMYLAIYSDSYIEYNVLLDEMDLAGAICLEDFVEGYEQGDFVSMQEYIDLLIRCAATDQPTQDNEELAVEPADLLYAQAVLARNAGTITDDDLEMLTAYESVLNYWELNDINAVLNYSGFVRGYLSSDCQTPAQFGSAILENYSTISPTEWYDNIGIVEAAIRLSTKPSYTKYNLMSVVQKGDIVQETQGAIAQFTGHIAIIEGRFWDTKQMCYYLRTVESAIDGVVYGVLDDTRYDERGTKIHYVTSATQTQINNAVTFCINQLGKPYNWTAIVTQSDYCWTSSSATSWYCSELVWAAYYNQGINLNETVDLNGSLIPRNIYLPSQLCNSSKLTRRYISTS